MKRILVFFIIVFLTLCLACQPGSNKDLKVFISVDMEGIAGVISGSECSPRGRDYDRFRRIMTLETNAAIEGAVAVGAAEVVVRDGHGAKTNILPDLLHKKAKLLRVAGSEP